MKIREVLEGSARLTKVVQLNKKLVLCGTSAEFLWYKNIRVTSMFTHIAFTQSFFSLSITFCQLSAHAQSSLNGTMAADSVLLLSLVEEYVSGLQDSKAGDTATGKFDS